MKKNFPFYDTNKTNNLRILLNKVAFLLGKGSVANDIKQNYIPLHLGSGHNSDVYAFSENYVIRLNKKNNEFIPKSNWITQPHLQCIIDGQSIEIYDRLTSLSKNEDPAVINQVRKNLQKTLWLEGISTPVDMVKNDTFRFCSITGRAMIVDNYEFINIKNQCNMVNILREIALKPENDEIPTAEKIAEGAKVRVDQLEPISAMTVLWEKKLKNSGRKKQSTREISQ